MPYFVKGLLVVLVFAVTRIVQLSRRNKTGKKHSTKEEKHNTEKK